jgi:hypothetical protein
LEIKVYTKGDEQTAVDLWQEAISGLTDIVDSRIDIRARLSIPSQYFFVASIAGKVVGTALAGVNETIALLDHLAVNPNFRRKGIGTALLREAENRLSEAGFAALKIQLEAANEGALAFLKESGYKLEGLVNLGKEFPNNSNGKR